MSVRSKQSSKKSSVGKKEKKKKLEDSEEEIESSEEELDLTKECHPIGYYLNDRAEMINQMFSVIKGTKLKAMLPPILKDCDIEQLKLQCLDQLLGMSDKRITCILDGESLETSSESEVMESDEYDVNEKNGTTSGSHSDRSDDSQVVYHTNNVDKKHKKRKGDFNNEGKVKKIPKTDSEPVEQGKTLLEILELEMRARAIRALLKQSSTEKGNDGVIPETAADKNETKEPSGEVVDLTECEDDEFPPSLKKEKAEEEDIDKRVSNFEEKIEKSVVEKTNLQEDEKSKRLQAELEIRNKLFKKKIYRTRQQRMESEEEEKTAEKNQNEGNNSNQYEKVLIKQEPIEPQSTEVVVEDPEEGEISTSEDEYPKEIKQEPEEPTEEPAEEPAEELLDDFEAKIDKDAERVTAIDNGTFVGSENIENVITSQEEKEDKSGAVEDNVTTESLTKAEETDDGARSAVQESDTPIGETSWRDRWLQKDGVQKLVKSSKIYAKVKKRIAEKSQKAKEEVPIPYEANSDSNSNSKLEMIEGSIEEYERLLGKNGNSQQSAVSEVVSKVPENVTESTGK